MKKPVFRGGVFPIPYWLRGVGGMASRFQPLQAGIGLELQLFNAQENAKGIST